MKTYMFCLFELEFYGPVNTVKVILSPSVNIHFSWAGLVLYAANQYLIRMHILSPVTDNCLSWISRRKRIFFFYLSCTALSQIFHLYRVDHLSKVCKKMENPGKTTSWPSISRTWLSDMWPCSNHSSEKPNGLRVSSLIHYTMGRSEVGVGVVGGGGGGGGWVGSGVENNYRSNFMINIHGSYVVELGF